MKSCRARVAVSVPPSSRSRPPAAETDLTKRVAGSIYAALAPDLKRLPADGSRARILVQDSEVVFEVEAGDLPALRASINSFVRLADASYRCIERDDKNTGE